MVRVYHSLRATMFYHSLSIRQSVPRLKANCHRIDMPNLSRRLSRAFERIQRVNIRGSSQVILLNRIPLQFDCSTPALYLSSGEKGTTLDAPFNQPPRFTILPEHELKASGVMDPSSSLHPHNQFASVLSAWCNPRARWNTLIY